MKCKINLNDDHVRLVDCIKDPYERDALESWDGVEGFITHGGEEKFGPRTATFLREAFKQQEIMKAELAKKIWIGLVL
jgi:hypothetical protein